MDDPTVFVPRRHPSISRLEYIAGGKASVVYAIDEDRILKTYHYDEDENDGKQVEREVYRRLSPHPHIAKYMGTCDDGSIILERGRPLRDLLQKEEIPAKRKICWAEQAAQGYKRMHDNNIIHADVGLHNMITTVDGLKILDFEGASIDGNPPDSLYEWFSHRRAIPVGKQTDIFAYGCALFELMSGKPPYHEYASEPNPAIIVNQLYDGHNFPDTAHLPLGQLIEDCWRGQFKTMDEILQILGEDACIGRMPSRGLVRRSKPKKRESLWYNLQRVVMSGRISTWVAWTRQSSRGKGRPRQDRICEV